MRPGLVGDAELGGLRDLIGGSPDMRVALRSDGSPACRCGEPHPTVFVGARPEDRALPAPTRAALRALPRGQGLAARSSSAILHATTLAVTGSHGLRISTDADLGPAEGEVAVVHMADLARAVAHHSAPQTLRIATAALLEELEGAEPDGWQRVPAADSLRALVEALGGRLARDQAPQP
ncbi:MAG: hypothetical protein MSC31_08475 [Solirubrobacteraceae bacterium MAG38_C4-C5]|nr:hypothetical protein [Candidatus Siliceabacter maunaloa]